MSFDIEKMKADGVSEHLIYLASVAPEVLMIRVARRLENDRLFQQFMGELVSEIEQIYPYAVAAGLMSEADRLWLVDAENTYRLQSGEVWYTGTLDECQEAYTNGHLSETNKAQTADIIANHSDYSVSINSIPLVFAAETEENLIFADSTEESLSTIALQINKIYPPQNGSPVAWANVKCPTNITTVEVAVAHK